MPRRVRKEHYKIIELPEGCVEGYLLNRNVLHGRYKNVHYFIIANALEDNIQRYYLPRYLSSFVDEYMGEFVQIHNNNKKFTITPGGKIE